MILFNNNNFSQIAKWLQVLLLNTNFIQHYSFIYSQLNDYKYCYVILTIPFK